MRFTFSAMLALGLVAAAAVHASAANYVIDTATASADHYLDRWMYPFNGTPGFRTAASTFGALGSQPSFDERDSQFLLAFNTAAVGVPAGLGASNYVITSARLTIAEQGVGGYESDPTADAFATYLDPSAAAYATDADAGRPIELFAAAFRGAFTQFGWPDGNINTPAPAFSAGSPFGPSGAGTRNAFAVDATGADVSNHVDYLGDGAAGFEPQRLAVAQAGNGGTPIAAGGAVPQGATLSFEFDLSNPNVVAYLQDALNDGQVGLVVSSLHSASFGGGPAFPQFATAQNSSFAPPVFEIAAEAVPEPSTVALVWVAGAMFALAALRRRRTKRVARS